MKRGTSRCGPGASRLGAEDQVVVLPDLGAAPLEQLAVPVGDRADRRIPGATVIVRRLVRDLGSLKDQCRR